MTLREMIKTFCQMVVQDKPDNDELKFDFRFGQTSACVWIRIGHQGGDGLSEGILHYGQGYGISRAWILTATGCGGGSQSATDIRDIKREAQCTRAHNPALDKVFNAIDTQCPNILIEPRTYTARFQEVNIKQEEFSSWEADPAKARAEIEAKLRERGKTVVGFVADKQG